MRSQLFPWRVPGKVQGGLQGAPPQARTGCLPSLGEGLCRHHWPDAGWVGPSGRPRPTARCEHGGVPGEGLCWGELMGTGCLGEGSCPCRLAGEDLCRGRVPGRGIGKAKAGRLGPVIGGRRWFAEAGWKGGLSALKGLKGAGGLLRGCSRRLPQALCGQG